MSRIPITDPALRLLVLRQLLQSEHPGSQGKPNEPGHSSSTLKVLAELRVLPLLELAQLARLLRPDTMVIDLGESEHPQTESIGSLFHVRMNDAAKSTLILAQLLQHTETSAFDEAAHSRVAPWQELFASKPQSATEAASPACTVSVSLPCLAWDITLHQRMATEREMFHYFVKAHASSRMLAALFQVTPGKVRAVQAMLGVNPRQGRCVSPPEADQIDLAAEWDLMTRQERLTPREMFYRLHHKHPHFTMAQLYGVIQKEKKGYPSYSATKPLKARESCGASHPHGPHGLYGCDHMLGHVFGHVPAYLPAYLPVSSPPHVRVLTSGPH